MARVETTLDALDLGQYIRPGDGIVFQQGCGEAVSLTERLVAQRAAYSGAGIFFGSGFSKTFQPGHADHLRFKGIGGIGTLRKLASAGKLDPVPCHISSIEGLLRSGVIRCDVALLQVSPANEQRRTQLRTGQRLHPRRRGQGAGGDRRDQPAGALGALRPAAARRPRSTWPVETDRAPVEVPAAPIGELESRIAAPLRRLHSATARHCRSASARCPKRSCDAVATARTSACIPGCSATGWST